ncbi:toll-like receptor 2 [Petromyzon marinus]|uniref:toll-like receptor 2 n=1 Tax=Petromyzon marinus TaxID=7757 RepID=UPI003F70B99F
MGTKMNLLVFATTLLCVVQLPQASTQNLDNPYCSYDDHQQTADCSDRDFTAVPQGLPATVTVLDLSHNRIGAIRLGDFSSTPKLEVLILAFNRIGTIEAGALRDVPLVRYLDLYQNELPAVPEGALIDLPNLQTLNISMNNYTSFALGGAFSRMSRLQSLSIGTSHTSELKAADLQALSNISLTYLGLNTGSPLLRYESGSLVYFRSLKTFFMNFSVDGNPSIFSKVLIDLNTSQTTQLETYQILIEPLKNRSFELFHGLSYCQSLREIIIVNANFSDSEATNFIKNMYLSNLKMVVFTNSSYNDKGPVVFLGIKGVNKTAPLKRLVIDGVFHLNMTYPLFLINFTLFPNLTEFKISNTGMNKVACLFLKIAAITWLDFSRNLLDETGLWWESCNYTVILPNAEYMDISHNHFRHLKIISSMVSLMPKIKSLDLSYNYINDIYECSWPNTLQKLNLRNNDITKNSKICTSKYLQALDLSYTRLETFPYNILAEATSLKELYLSGNNIRHINPQIGSASLQVLYMDDNALGIIRKGTFENLQAARSLNLKNNPFYCFCDLYWFRKKFNKSLLMDWPNGYTCSYPDYLADSPLEVFSPSYVACDRNIIIILSVVITACVIGITAGLSYHLDAVWYIRMGWIWVSAKRRRYNRLNDGETSTFQYHAFISYSQLDSDWVENTLVPTLESSNPDLKLCIHERDFTPGEWIVDNIIQCIEHSNKTLFILSRNFVNSEWCHYELYFAQHRVLEQRQDSLVLLLLEPLPRNSVPSKFCRLRKLLNRKTYLEWPAEEGKRSMFWASLRALLQSDNRPLESSPDPDA